MGDPITLSQFIFHNIWFVIAAAASIAFSCGAVYLTITSTMKHVVNEVATLHLKVSHHDKRITNLEVAQADRLGYERAVRDMQEKYREGTAA